jgi:type VI secretion system ImpM family protein
MQSVVFPAFCFGKLPSQADFVRFNASSREVLAFDQWVQHGLHALRTQRGIVWEREFDDTPGYHFIFSSENTERIIIGVMKASADRSKRRYPFFVSALVSKRSLTESQIALIPALCADFFDQAEVCSAKALNGIDVRDLQTQIARLQDAQYDGVTGSRKFVQFLDQMSNEAYWENVLGNFDDRRKYLMMMNLMEVLRPFRGRSLARLLLGLRFPLSNTPHGVRNEVCFWMRVCSEILDTSLLSPAAFWTEPAPPRTPYLFLFFRQPSPNIFASLVNPQTQNDNICMLDEEGRERFEKGYKTLPPQLQALLDNRTKRFDQVVSGIRVMVP